MAHSRRVTPQELQPFDWPETPASQAVLIACTKRFGTAKLSENCGYETTPVEVVYL